MNPFSSVSLRVAMVVALTGSVAFGCTKKPPIMGHIDAGTGDAGSMDSAIDDAGASDASTDDGSTIMDAGMDMHVVVVPESGHCNIVTPFQVLGVVPGLRTHGTAVAAVPGTSPSLDALYVQGSGDNEMLSRQSFSVNGGEIGEPFTEAQVVPGASSIFVNPVVAQGPTAGLVAFESPTPNGLRVYYRRLDAAGRPVDSDIPHELTTDAGAATEPVLQPVSGGGFVVAWKEAPSTGVGGATGAPDTIGYAHVDDTGVVDVGPFHIALGQTLFELTLARSSGTGNSALVYAVPSNPLDLTAGLGVRVRPIDASGNIIDPISSASLTPPFDSSHPPLTLFDGKSIAPPLSALRVDHAGFLETFVAWTEVDSPRTDVRVERIYDVAPSSIPATSGEFRITSGPLEGTTPILTSYTYTFMGLPAQGVAIAYVVVAGVSSQALRILPLGNECSAVGEPLTLIDFPDDASVGSFLPSTMSVATASDNRTIGIALERQPGDGSTTSNFVSVICQ